MSVLTKVFSGNYTVEWNGIEEENVPQNYREYARLGYDARYVKTHQEKIAEARNEDERILLAANLAHSRSSVRHLGPPINIEYSPRIDDGYDDPARGALAWLAEHGEKVGISLHLKE
jgi:hypothetical protein